MGVFEHFKMGAVVPGAIGTGTVRVGRLGALGSCALWLSITSAPGSMFL